MLDGALGDEAGAVADGGFVFLKYFCANDEVYGSGFVFERDKDYSGGSAWALAYEHKASSGGARAVREKGFVF